MNTDSVCLPWAGAPGSPAEPGSSPKPGTGVSTPFSGPALPSAAAGRSPPPGIIAARSVASRERCCLARNLAKELAHEQTAESCLYAVVALAALAGLVLNALQGVDLVERWVDFVRLVERCF